MSVVHIAPRRRFAVFSISSIPGPELYPLPSQEKANDIQRALNGAVPWQTGEDVIGQPAVLVASYLGRSWYVTLQTNRSFEMFRSGGVDYIDGDGNGNGLGWFQADFREL
jgi:hypothetical protein